jgi:hypothetical protein
MILLSRRFGTAGDGIDQFLAYRAEIAGTAIRGIVSSYRWKTLPCGNNSQFCGVRLPKRLKLKPTDRIFRVRLRLVWTDWNPR